MNNENKAKTQDQNVAHSTWSIEDVDFVLSATQKEKETMLSLKEKYDCLLALTDILDDTGMEYLRDIVAVAIADKERGEYDISNTLARRI